MYYCYVETPVGDLLLAGDADALHVIGFPEGAMRRVFIVVLNRSDAISRLRAKFWGKGFERY